MAPKKKVTADAPEGETLTRIAIVNQDRLVVMRMHMLCNKPGLLVCQQHEQ
jgi:hypothetical protein